METAKIAFLIPYLGRWPAYTDLFLRSCDGNKVVNIFLIAENAPRPALPPNVKHVRMSRTEIWERIEKTTQLALSEPPGHKLCDFRPFYGLAFTDLLGPYPFWGFCDIDLMFGDLGKFFNEQTLASLDVFSAHSNQFVGHCTFLRNREDINRLGFEISNWQQLCKSPIAEHVDEERFSEVLRCHPGIRWARPELLVHEIEKPLCRHAITFSFGGKVADSAQLVDPVVTWEKGVLKLERDGKHKTEILYVHFMGLKHPWHWPAKGHLGLNHVFSKLGYGRVRSAGDLKKIRWRILYVWQCLLLQTKKLGGRILKPILPSEKIRALRRAVGV